MANLLKIGTHDSATGEKGLWYCFPLIPFAKTQSKTLVEQYNNGCRLFDIRIKKYRGEWHCAHGIWISKDNVFHILDSLHNVITDELINPTYVSITFEGKNPDREELKKIYHDLIDRFINIKFYYLAIKYGDESSGVKVKYTFLEYTDLGFEAVQGFLPLDGRSWHTYLPIPYLWKKIYHNNTEFNEKTFTYVDFL